MNDLSKLLNDAADEKVGAAESFFELLLDSEVYIPVQGQAEKNPANIEIGKAHVDSLGYLTLDYEGNECLPIFTEESYLHHWAKREIGVAKKDFKSLLWLLGDSLWLYIDPDQEIGKEITAWEVSMLKKGKEAIPDVVAALGDGEQSIDLEVDNDSDLYPELKRKLLPILELAKSLDEAFLISVKDDNSESKSAMLGLRYAEDDKTQKQFIRDELNFLEANIIVVDNLGSGPNDTLFEGARPFFIAQKESKKSSFLSSISNLLKKGAKSIKS